MKLSRTDVRTLAIVAASGAFGLAVFGPRMWAEEVFVTIDGERESEHFEWTSAESGLEPLFYVDGDFSDRTVLDELDPDQIERIEVLKGQGAIDLYGPEATVGVIQIFTKDGSGSN